MSTSYVTVPSNPSSSLQALVNQHATQPPTYKNGKETLGFQRVSEVFSETKSPLAMQLGSLNKAVAHFLSTPLPGAGIVPTTSPNNQAETSQNQALSPRPSR